MIDRSSILKTAIFPIVALILTPVAASACVSHKELDFEDIKYADVVFQGKLISYEYIPNDPNYVRRYSLLKVEVSDTLKGEERTEWELIWQSSPFGPAAVWNWGSDVLIAGLWSNDTDENPVIRSYGAREDIKPELLNVLQDTCSDPFIFAATESVFGNVKAALEDTKRSNHD
ncbi:MAG: hypothetical protein AAFX54_09295 [Pseudomonadota bacterium]